MSESIKQVKAVKAVKAGIGTGSGITQGSWEAEGNVIVIRPERNTAMMILYEANTINSGIKSNTTKDVDVVDTINADNAEHAKRTERTERTELESNARAIAAVPDMIRLLEEILSCSRSYCLSDHCHKELQELVLRIRGIDIPE